MDICLIKKQLQSTAPLPLVFIPEELIAEILSLLSVKTISRFKCVNKLWNTLISDPTFVDKHLKKSSQKQHLIVVWRDTRDLIMVPFPLYDLHQNPSITRCLNDDYYTVGTCNGLICLYTKSLYKVSRSVEYMEYSIHLWNPSTRKKSEKLVSFSYFSYNLKKFFKFAFCYDDSKKTYKVVAYHIQSCTKSEVKVFSLGGNVWRNIQSFPVVPLNWTYYETCPYNGVHLSNTINWLAINEYSYSSYQYRDITHVEQIVIISLDLSTETYKVLLMPQGLVEVPRIQPVVNVLMECLCFSHQVEDEFVLWQMKEYGIQESWSQLFKISYQILPMDFKDERFRMACIYKNGDMVIFVSDCHYDKVIYNLRDKKVETLIVNGCGYWFGHVNVYGESLVAVC
ncbi:hypothetical protein RYX36_028882 [Vicia faba]